MILGIVLAVLILLLLEILFYFHIKKITPQNTEGRIKLLSTNAKTGAGQFTLR